MPAGPKGKLELKEIGLRIRRLRGELLQDELAAYLNISQGQLSKIEGGRIAPTLDTVAKIAEKYNVSIDWIIYG